jgi:hypothetical protein
LHTVFSSI